MKDWHVDHMALSINQGLGLALGLVLVLALFINNAYNVQVSADMVIT